MSQLLKIILIYFSIIFRKLFAGNDSSGILSDNELFVGGDHVYGNLGVLSGDAMRI